MIDRFLAGVQRGITDVIGILVLFALLIDLVIWTRNNPHALQMLIDKLVDAVVSLVSWLCDLIVRALDRSGE